ncbi:CASC1 [Lepeophtheirus salmonis]|uniref:CASC1 n=1 Tax=Lepeophtheirus salmonis TaxID=72036 RepID=A0A7R8CRR8_LEPSM|nr:CASC1 [Lepeophtheirus salmonis]CAF2858909.1 CASC1 [Lepeophtheirus salmonis]
MSSRKNLDSPSKASRTNEFSSDDEDAQKSTKTVPILYNFSIDEARSMIESLIKKRKDYKEPSGWKTKEKQSKKCLKEAKRYSNNDHLGKNLIENPELWEDPEEVDITSRKYQSKLLEQNKIFMEMKKLQLQKLNIATYNILLDVSPMVDLENNVLQHYLTSDLVSLGESLTHKKLSFLYLFLKFEIRTLGKCHGPKNMKVKGTEFEDLGFGFELPLSLMGTVGAVRVMRVKVKYDHYSKMCRSNKIPPRAEKDIPSYISQIERKILEMEDIVKICEDQHRLQQIEEERARDEAETLRQLEIKARKASKSVRKREKAFKWSPLLIQGVKMDPLKKILEGYFTLIYWRFLLSRKKVGDWIICQLETPQALKTVSWKADYKKPNTDEGANSNNAVTKKTPEEIEREIKEQEMELQKLVLVYLKLPSSALWFEPPTIVRWESEKGYWSTNGFYDIKFDEGKQTLSFRTLSFGIFALSAFRYSNLPLQSWELKPESENSALITLSAAAVQAEFLIGEGVITLKKFSCGNKPPVKGLQDKPMAVKDLIKEMRMQGVDIFPDYDSHCYIEGRY